MKSILVFCPVFYEYEIKIKEELELKGYRVHAFFYNEKDMLSISFLTRSIIKLLSFFIGNYRFFKKLKNKYFNIKSKLFFDKIITEIEGLEYDKLLVIKGFGLNCKHIEKINAKDKVIYQWDSIDNYPLIPLIYPKFDRVFTFDYQDSENGLGSFLPNFYVKRDIRKVNFTYELFFIGLYTEYRYNYLKKIILKAQELEVSYFIKLVNRNPFLYIGKNKDIFVNKAFSRLDYEEFLDSSRIIFELPNKGQEGSTQRLLEGLVQGKVICSSNVNMAIKSEGIISIDDFLSLDKTTYQEMISKDLVTDNKKLIETYEISNWINILLS